jgi:hypothetical protein
MGPVGQGMGWRLLKGLLAGPAGPPVGESAHSSRHALSALSRLL